MGFNPNVGMPRIGVVEENMRGFRGLTVDAFGTLLDGGPDHLPQILEPVAREQGLDRVAAMDAWEDVLRGHLDNPPFVPFEEAHRRTFAELFRRWDVTSDPQVYAQEVLSLYREARAYPEVSAVLDDLTREVVIAIVSNVDTALLLEVLQRNELFIPYVITSEEEMGYKPAAALYERAIRHLGLPAEHILHVGDSVVDDVRGAAALGMGTAWMRRENAGGEPGEADFVVSNLADVLEVLHRSWEEDTRT